MKNGTRPLMVTIQCLAYNHEPYIRQCLEGFVMQKTTFRFEAIVHDDASTDGTAAIIREYAEKYPDIIKPILETENQFSKQNGVLNEIMNEHTKGKYVALCEGDDYWIDPNKLQRQVDWMELNPKITYTCTRYMILNQNTGTISKADNSYFDIEKNRKKGFFEFTRDDAFAKDWITKTLTCVYRKKNYDSEYMSQFKYSRDVHLVYMLLSSGKGVCFSSFSGVYRQNQESVFGGKSELEKALQNYNVYEELYRAEKDNVLRDRVIGFYKALALNGITPPQLPEKKIQLFVNLIYLPVKRFVNFMKKIIEPDPKEKSNN